MKARLALDVGSSSHSLSPAGSRAQTLVLRFVCTQSVHNNNEQTKSHSLKFLEDVDGIHPLGHLILL